MATELQMSSGIEDGVDFPYKAISRGAIFSVIFALLALPGLLQDFSPLLAIALLGTAAAIVGWIANRRYPDEYGGMGLAKAGLAINLVLLCGGIGMHVYTYMTEVPDGYTRVHFYELQQGDTAVGMDRPTEKAVQVSGEDIFLKGYIHPSSGSGLLKHFILVPDLGTCCFGGQPESSDMVEVTLTGGQTTKANLRKKKLAGKFLVNQAATAITDFDNSVFYRMRVDLVK